MEVGSSGLFLKVVFMKRDGRFSLWASKIFYYKLLNKRLNFAVPELLLRLVLSCLICFFKI